MVRFFLALVLLGFVAAAAGFVYLGVFPPVPAIHTVNQTLPNSGFKTS